jgi:putative salt-induced outer membrane protein YdiY
MYFTRRFFTIAVLIVFVSCPRAFADQVGLKNGDRLSGTIVKSDGKTLVMKTEFAGDVSIQWDAVTAIDSSQALHLGLKDGQTVVGAVTTSDGKFSVATKDAGTVSTSKEAVATVRNDAEAKAYDAEIDRLRNPHLTDFWSGMVDTGLSLTRGNSATLNYSLAAKAVRSTARDKITVYSTAIYAKDSTAGPSVTTAHAIRGGVRADINVSARTFVFGFTDFEYDQFQKLNLRNVIGGGFGYHVIKTERSTFDVFGGGSYNQEFFSTGLTRKTGEVLAGEEFDAKLSGRTTLSERFAFYPNLSNRGQYRFTFDTTAATKLKAWLSWQAGFSNRFLSDPVPGTKKNDLLLTTGVRFTFGKGLL